MRSFGSDNHSGVHPLIFESLAQANQDHAPSYGTDEWSERARQLFKKEFGTQAETFFVFNGTAANVLALRALVKPYQSIFCSDVAHLQVDECGAPEFFTGAKLRLLPNVHGKIQLQDLKDALIRRGDQHYSQPAAVSITQPTEFGTCYTVSEIKELVEFAHKEGLKVHVDGARLPNAVHFLKTTFKEMLTDTGVDVVSFGGTKNGLMAGEAVVFLNAALASEFAYVRKQSAQLPSKTRYIAAQFETFLKNGLWQEISAHSHGLALKLADEVSKISGLEVTRPVESNAVFIKIPKPWVKRLREKYFFYVWDEKTFECRLMTTWDTHADEISDFAKLLKEQT